jgi:hypothetical protein
LLPPDTTSLEGRPGAITGDDFLDTGCGKRLDDVPADQSRAA